MKNFALRIKMLRKELKLTQIEMAEMLAIGGRQYQNYEGAISYPDVAGLIRIADYFGVSVDYLLGRTHRRTIEKEDEP